VHTGIEVGDFLRVGGDEIIAQLKALNIPKLGVMEPGKIYEW